MSILDWFAKNKKYASNKERLNIPSDLWVKCFKCNGTLFLKELEANLKVCPNCQYHFRITPKERISQIFDPNSFTEIDKTIKPIDFLGFKDLLSYKKRIEKAQKKTNENDAVITGTAKINGALVNIGVMDFHFLGGSMGSVVGEKVTRIIEAAIKNKRPLIIFSASGGARMQEGIMSLMQMAKTSAALAKLSNEKIPFISVLCDPTTGGTSASFAMLGDILIAEPDALISFAGPRVIEQTIRQKLPKGFQRSEFLLSHGIIDMVAKRKELPELLYKLISILSPIQKRKSIS